jgi:AraC family transcriptional regulator, regulatory protein of adaptative response / methylated-DNA-[protein]-cysteine methyltransferase
MRVEALAMRKNFQQSLDPALAWRQVLARDANAVFFYRVSSTGIFCRPGCPSRRPAQRNVAFFANAAEAMAAGYRACRRCAPLGRHPEAEVVARLCRHLARHRDRTQTLSSLGKLAKCSPYTVQRTFERVLGISPREYQAHLRANAFRDSLSTNAGITEAMYQAGYSSPSRLYEHSTATLGMSPTRFRDGGRGETIRFSTARCVLGLLLVAATGRGLCGVMLGEDPSALEATLREQFPKAEIFSDTRGLKKYLSGILSYMKEHPAFVDLPLDVRATAFQARVWEALKRIPRGETRSYAQLASDLGQPTAIRAVARACASNPVAIVIPCHRVIGSSGGLSGYRWGIERKATLLKIEKSSKT